MMDPNHPMNALMRLNQIHPGLQYRLLSQSGPVHAPVFTMSVDIQGTTYQATGNSKKTAKLQVALKVFNRVWILQKDHLNLCSLKTSWQGLNNYENYEYCTFYVYELWLNMRRYWLNFGNGRYARSWMALAHW